MKINQYSHFILERLELLMETKLEMGNNLLYTLKKMKSPVAEFILGLADEDLDIDISILNNDPDKSGNITYYPVNRLQGKKFHKVLRSDSCLNGIDNALEFFKVPELSTAVAGELGEIIQEVNLNKIHSKYPSYQVCLFKTVDNRYVLIGKEYLSEDTFPEKRFEQSAKSGRIIGKILKEVQKEFTAKEIEEFSNEFKSMSEFKAFNIVSGEDIRHWYLGDNYITGGGTLQNSCMRYSRCQSYFDLYVENPKVCQLLILLSKVDNSKISGRALVWTANDGNIYLDRIYYTHDYEVNMFIQHADEQGWYHKVVQDSSSSNGFVNKAGDNVYEITVELAVGKSDISKFPYMDTLKYLDDQELSTNGYGDELEDTEGGDGTCNECGGSGHLTCGECNGDGEENCRNCGASGEVDCSECDGAGEIDCGHCHGASDVECPECNGTGEVNDEECSNCNGIGNVPCTDCTEGKVKCPECEGKGTETCSDCEGKGEIECSDCYGRGEVDCYNCN